MCDVMLMLNSQQLWKMGIMDTGFMARMSSLNRCFVFGLEILFCYPGPLCFSTDDILRKY